MYKVEKVEDQYLGGLLTIAKSFLSEYAKELNSEYSVSAVIESFIKFKDTSLVLLCDSEVVGVISGIPVQGLIDKQSIMQELLWYVLPSHRKHGVKLYREFENMVKNMGINRIVMASIANDKEEKVNKFYERNGFVKVETHFLKVINNADSE